MVKPHALSKKNKFFTGLLDIIRYIHVTISLITNFSGCIAVFLVTNTTPVIFFAGFLVTV